MLRAIGIETEACRVLPPTDRRNGAGHRAAVQRCDAPATTDRARPAACAGQRCSSTGPQPWASSVGQRDWGQRRFARAGDNYLRHLETAGQAPMSRVPRFQRRQRRRRRPTADARRRPGSVVGGYSRSIIIISGQRRGRRLATLDQTWRPPASRIRRKAVSSAGRAPMDCDAVVSCLAVMQADRALLSRCRRAKAARCECDEEPARRVRRCVLRLHRAKGPGDR